MIIATLSTGGVFEVNSIEDLETQIVNWYAEEGNFSGIVKIEDEEENLIEVPKGLNERLEKLIETAKQELWENDGSDLSRDYELNLI